VIRRKGHCRVIGVAGIRAGAAGDKPGRHRPRRDCTARCRPTTTGVNEIEPTDMLRSETRNGLPQRPERTYVGPKRDKAASQIV
jgi:hypothetical protein